jgi:hypothetical protein
MATDKTQRGPEPGVYASNPVRRRVLDACERKDIDELRSIAIAPGGFLSDDLRSRACKSSHPSTADFIARS